MGHRHDLTHEAVRANRVDEHRRRTPEPHLLELRSAEVPEWRERKDLNTGPRRQRLPAKDARPPIGRCHVNDDEIGLRA